MGWFSKIIPKEVKKVFKPVAKFSQKFIPKEIRPFLPMVTPFLPAMGIMGQLGGPMGFAKMYGANLLSQQLADPGAEFDDLNQLAALLSGTQGGLMDRSSQLKGATTAGKFNPTTKEGILSQLQDAPLGTDSISQMPGFEEAMANRSMLTKAKDLGLEGLSKGAGYLEDTTKTLQQLGSGEAINVADAGKAAVMKDLFTKEGATALAKSAAVPFATGMGGVTEALQRPAIREFEKFEADEAAEIERTTTANDQERADYQMTFMRQAAIPEDEVKETLEMNDLGEYYVPPVTAAQGGIIGLKEGGRINFKSGGSDIFGIGGEEVIPKMGEKMGEGASFLSDLITDSEGNVYTVLQYLRKFGEDAFFGGQKNPELSEKFYNKLGDDYIQEMETVKERGYNTGGIIGLKEGGMLNFGGREMDLRTGGFVPIGRQERADDVPARLSKNEFVMTADAVRAAGGGSVNKGAQRMYDIMNKLEARA